MESAALGCGELPTLGYVCGLDGTYRELCRGDS